MGHRAGLARALRRAGVPYAVWGDRPVRSAAGADAVLVEPFSGERRVLERRLAPLRAGGEFSHVIAGTERAVYAASRARRVLDARRSADAVALRCRDKLQMKDELARHAVPMTEYRRADAAADPDALLAALGSPVVVKPRTSSGGRGIAFARDAAAVAQALEGALLVERFVDAPEMSVESFINGGEIQFASTTEYYVKRHVNVVPAGIDGALRADVLALNERVIRSLAIAWGIAHVELYLTPRGPLFGEIALRPPGGYLMEAIALAWSFDPWDAFVAMELDRPFAFPAAPRRHAAANVLHPGAGVVRAIEGEQAVRGDPTVTRASLKVAVGDEVRARAGAGDDIGYVLHVADTRSALLAGVDRCRACLRVHVD